MKIKRSNLSQRSECVEHCDEAFDRKPTVATTLQATDIALGGADHASNLLLGQPVRAPKNAELSPKLPHQIAPRLIALFNVLQRLAFSSWTDLQNFATFKSLQHLLVSPSVGRSSWIFANSSYRHFSPLRLRLSDRRDGKKAVIGHTDSSRACQRQTIFKDFPAGQKPTLT